MILNGQRITPKQERIIVLLHQFRGMRYDQLIPVLAERMFRQDALSFRKNTYKDLQTLEDLKLIIRDPLRLEHTIDFIYLSESGLDIACELLEIYSGHIGAGWDDDHGDFPYDLHRPPRVTSAVIHHHMMLTDVLLTLERLKHQLPDLQLTYRDNRYASIEFEWQGETRRFRPDAEFILRSRGIRYLVEVDRGTEFNEKLREKFRSLALYLRYLKDNGKDSPHGVIYIMNKTTTNGLMRRWSLIRSCFMNEMEEFSFNFNLIGSGVRSIKSTIDRQMIRFSDYRDFTNKMSYYKSDTVTFSSLKEGIGIPWISAPFSVVKAPNDETRFYVYDRYDEFETVGMARIYYWWKWYKEAKIKYSDIGASKHFYPVLWNPTSGFVPLDFRGFDSEEEFNTAFSHRLWLTTNPDPTWFTSSGEQITNGHPLTQL